MKTAEPTTSTPQRFQEDQGRPAPPGRRRTAAFTALAMLVAAVVGGGVVLAWQELRGTDSERALEQAIEQRDDALASVAALTATVHDLEDELTTATGDVAALEQQLARARARLRAVVGPPLEDGRHFGYLMAVGVGQEPPRLVFDLAEWFTDQEAIDAALEDGVPQGDAGINGYYIRNENARWRILEVDPAATVTLSTYPYADPANPVEVTLDRFAELYRSGEGTLRLSPYWLTARDGVVVAIEEQFVP